MQRELDAVIQQGVIQITRLLRNSETGISSGTSAAPDEDEFAIHNKKQNYLRSKFFEHICNDFPVTIFRFRSEIARGQRSPHGALIGAGNFNSDDASRVETRMEQIERLERIGRRR